MRTTYVLRDGVLVEKELAPPPQSKSVHIISDIQPFVSPIDRSVISSRSGVREHERVHGVKQVGNDFTPPSRVQRHVWQNGKFVPGPEGN